MGYRNAQAVIALWGHLPHGEFRMLIGMAVVVPDDSELKYYDGEKGLVQLLGRSRSSAYRTLNALIEKGALQPVQAGHTGARAEWRIVLDPSASRASRDTSGPGRGASENLRRGQERPVYRDTSVSRVPGRRVSRVPGHEVSRVPGHQQDSQDSQDREQDIPSVRGVRTVPDDDGRNEKPDLSALDETARRQLIQAHGLMPALRILGEAS